MTRLASIHKAQGKYKESLDDLEKSHALKDSLYTVEKAREVGTWKLHTTWTRQRDHKTPGSRK